jgi:hypothetical protein
LKPGYKHERMRKLPLLLIAAIACSKSASGPTALGDLTPPVYAVATSGGGTAAVDGDGKYWAQSLDTAVFEPEGVACYSLDGLFAGLPSPATACDVESGQTLILLAKSGKETTWKVCAGQSGKPIDAYAQVLEAIDCVLITRE